MRRLLSWMLTPLLAMAAFAGCADNESGMFVRGVLVLQQPECSVKADPTSPHRLGGVLDISLRDTYQAVLLVGNQLVPRGDHDKIRTETSRVTIKGAEVTLLTDTGSVIQEFSVPSSGFVDPGTSDDPGYGAADVTLIPAGLVAGAAAGGAILLVAEVRVFGDTLGGDEITSAPYNFNITVCDGCLISYPPDASLQQGANYICGSAVDQGSAPDAPCRIGQDEAVDCRVCASSNQRCVTPPPTS